MYANPQMSPMPRWPKSQIRIYTLDPSQRDPNPLKPTTTTQCGFLNELRLEAALDLFFQWGYWHPVVKLGYRRHRKITFVGIDFNGALENFLWVDVPVRPQTPENFFAGVWALDYPLEGQYLAAEKNDFRNFNWNSTTSLIRRSLGLSISE